MGDSFFDTCIECIQQARQIPLHFLLLFAGSTLIGLFLLVCLIMSSTDGDENSDSLTSLQLHFSLVFLGPRPRPPLPSERKYRTLLEDGTVMQPQPLPCWLDKYPKNGPETQINGRPVRGKTTIESAELFMSVVVPAYNEEHRLVGMLEEAVNYLENEYGTITDHASPTSAEGNEGILRRRPNGHTNGKANGGSFPTGPNRGWEILLIDDGSKDATLETTFGFARTHQLPSRPRRLSGPWTHRAEHAVNIPTGSIRVVSLVKNRGKGGAVTHGMRHVRGQYVVFADADGASKFDDLSKLVTACEKVEDAEGRGIAIGSRAHLVGSEAVVKRSKLRNFLMHSFHLLLKWMTPPRTAAIRDTQCGFKLFSRPSLPYIIPYMHNEGWIFDVEMLMLAEFAGIPVVEVPIGWREVLGSKLNVIWDSLGMAYGLALLRLCWGLGIYRRD
jgi:dolichyl-phosphate beta-glucosyltransferase